MRAGTLVWREQPRLVFLNQWGDPVEDSISSSKINLKILKRGQINTSLSCLLTAHPLHNGTHFSLGWLLIMSAPMEAFSSFSNFINWQVAQQWPRRKFTPLREWPASGRLPDGDRDWGLSLPLKFLGKKYALSTWVQTLTATGTFTSPWKERVGLRKTLLINHF